MAGNNPYRIVIAEPFDPEAVARLAEYAQVETLPDSAPPTILGAIGTADALLVRSKAHVTARMIEAAPRLKVIGRAGPSVDHIDIRAAKRRNISVVYSPNVAVDSMAEFTLALMLALNRRIIYFNRHIRQGEFENLRMPAGYEFGHRLVGFLGVDAIAARLAQMCSAAFRSNMLFHDPTSEALALDPAQRVDLDTLLARVDILSVHLQLTPETRGLLNAEQFAKLKSSAVVVNTSRGGVIDTTALADALKARRLAGAALDVYEVEPLPTEHPLRTAPNCILTPHVAAATLDVTTNRFQVVEDVLRVLRGESPLYPAESPIPKQRG